MATKRIPNPQASVRFVHFPLSALSVRKCVGSPGCLTWEHLAGQAWSPPSPGITEDLGQSTRRSAYGGQAGS